MLRFSVATDGAPTAAQWRELARKAEASGYYSLSLTDHLSQAMAPFTALAAAAAVTTTLRLGTYVLCQDFRGPVIVAKELATLDVLSAGRVEAGLGAGWRKRDYAQGGIPFSSGPERFERFTEYVEIVSDLLAGRSVTFEGRHFSVIDATCVPVAVQRTVPLLIGGSRRQSIGLAARRADIVSIAPSTAADGRRLAFWEADVESRVSWARAAAAGRPSPPEIDIAIHECWVQPNPGPLVARLSAARGIPPERLGSIPSFLVGDPGHVTEVLLARHERWGVTRVTVPASAIDMMAPVVARLASH
jgi:probable F420-dependent oxidoreductase